MNILTALIKRNIRLFFKDKAMFFTSLITPVILLVLYVSFLASVYNDTYVSIITAFGFESAVSEDVIQGCVSGQLISSILAVSCITVSFCSNMLMVQDKVNGVRKDLTVSPISLSTLALSYYVSTFISSLMICVCAAAICLIYVAATGWFLAFTDILFLLLDIVLLVTFGTALSSIVSHFLSSQGQISAVGTIVSSGYGFICGAYMPISQFSEGLQKIISVLPGTYGTSLIRNHSLNGVFNKISELGVSDECIEELRKVTDCDIYVSDTSVSLPIMYLILIATIVVLVSAYIIIANRSIRKAK